VDELRSELERISVNLEREVIRKKDKEFKLENTILLVGMSGGGKSCMINSFYKAVRPELGKNIAQPKDTFVGQGTLSFNEYKFSETQLFVDRQDNPIQIPNTAIPLVKNFRVFDSRGLQTAEQWSEQIRTLSLIQGHGKANTEVEVQEELKRNTGFGFVEKIQIKFHIGDGLGKQLRTESRSEFLFETKPGCVIFVIDATTTLLPKQLDIFAKLREQTKDAATIVVFTKADTMLADEWHNKFLEYCQYLRIDPTKIQTYVVANYTDMTAFEDEVKSRNFLIILINALRLAHHAHKYLQKQ